MSLAMGTLVIHRQYFMESDICDGDFPRDPDSEESDMFEGIGASEAARILHEEGLSFAATGNNWAADPDGSYVVDYGTGRRVEVSGHLSGFHERVERAIIAKVG